jgi:hypothetical protein
LLSCAPAFATPAPASLRPTFAFTPFAARQVDDFRFQYFSHLFQLYLADVGMVDPQINAGHTHNLITRSSFAFANIASLAYEQFTHENLHTRI